MRKNKFVDFMKKRGTIVTLSLCLVGAAGFSALYAVNKVEKAKEQQERLIDLNDSSAEEEGKTVKGDTVGPEKKDESKPGEKETEEKAEAANNADVLSESEAKALEGKDSADARTEDALDASAGIMPTVNFTDADTLTWPVAGTVLMDYSMNGTVYFKTLNQYKYNPALIIGCEEGSQVVAAAKGIVESVDVDGETGTTVTMNIGNNYELVYGQLKDVAVNVGDIVDTGSLLGYVNAPTKYYCEEGTNLYFQMNKQGVPEDPFLYLE